MRDPSVIASDPEISAWVAANAGAGKTYTLANRVARLLLADAEPPKILCLTFTKAAAAEMQVRLFNQHPTGKALKHERLQALMGDGGIQECGFAQNCVEVCPKDIPLTKAIADTGREVMKQAIKDFFRG